MSRDQTRWITLIGRRRVRIAVLVPRCVEPEKRCE